MMVAFSGSRKRSAEKNKGRTKIKETIWQLKTEENKAKKYQLIKTRLLCQAK